MAFIRLRDLTSLHEAYAASIGRALVVCQHLESCVHHVMVTWAVTDATMSGSFEHDELRAIALKLRNLRLHSSIQRLKNADDFGDHRAEILDIAREARNWLVHEAGDVVQVAFGISTLLERISEFFERMELICEADALISKASYEIAERERAPIRHSEEYPKALTAWVTGPILDEIGESTTLTK